MTPSDNFKMFFFPFLFLLNLQASKGSLFDHQGVLPSPTIGSPLATLPASADPPEGGPLGGLPHETVRFFPVKLLVIWVFPTKKIRGFKGFSPKSSHEKIGIFQPFFLNHSFWGGYIPLFLETPISMMGSLQMGL